MKRKRDGLTYIEVLFTLLLLSIALLGIDTSQALAYKKTQMAYYTAVAIQQMSNLLEFKRFNAGLPNANFISNWNLQNREVLPNGAGYIDETKKEAVLSWGKTKNNHCVIDADSGCIKIKI